MFVTARASAITALFTGAAGIAHAQWTVTNLHPATATESRAFGTHTGQQVGDAKFGGLAHACLWNGTAASWVDLHPAGATDISQAFGVHDGRQVGTAWVVANRASVWDDTAASWVNLWPSGPSNASAAHAGKQAGWIEVGFNFRASLWSGTSSSRLDLHPAGATSSMARGMDSQQQVGSAWFGGVGHAGSWSGTAASWVDLHPAGAVNSRALGVHAGQQAGSAQLVLGADHASLWTGTAASWVDLHPAGATTSEASAVFGSRQAGWAVVDGVSRASVERHCLVVGGSLSGPDRLVGSHVRHGHLERWDHDVRGGLRLQQHH